MGFRSKHDLKTGPLGFPLVNLIDTFYTGVVSIQALGATGDGVTDDTEAINAAYAKGSLFVRWPPGTYRVSKSITPGAKRTITYFDSVTIKATDTAVATDFNELKGWNLESMDTLSNANTNFPTAEKVYVLFDTSTTRNSVYLGQVEFNGNGLANLALIGSSNKDSLTTEAGGGKSSWQCNILLNNAEYGLFGQPRYDSPDATFYPDPFVGCYFENMKINANVTVPILAGDNTFDDCFFASLTIAASGPSYFFNTHIQCGSLFINGSDANDYALDVQSASMNWASLYAEGTLQAPIIARDLAQLSGMCRYGAGANTTFGKKCIVYFTGAEGSAFLSAHARNTAASDMDALVKLKSLLTDANGARSIVVQQPYNIETKDAFQFDFDGGTDRTSTIDNLIAYTSRGVTGYQFVNSTLEGYMYRSGLVPHEEIRDPSNNTDEGMRLSFRGEIQISTNQTTGYTLQALTASTDSTGRRLEYTVVAFNPTQAHVVFIAAPTVNELGRQMTVTNIGAVNITLVDNANLDLGGANVILPANENRGITLLARDSSGSRNWVWEEAVNRAVQTFTASDATPSVAAGTVFKTANAAPTTITDFDDGHPGMEIKVIIDDTNTTIDFTASGLKGNVGVDWSPTTGDHMTCVYDGTDWFCDISDNTA